MVDVIELLNYNREIRHRYFDALKQLSWEDVIKNREASFHSLRNIFLHTLNAINYWLDFLENTTRYKKHKFDDYQDFDTIKEYVMLVEARMRNYLSTLTPQRLMKKYSLQVDSPQGSKTIEATTEDILIHVFEEEVHHRGELIALFWQMGIEPPIMGWKTI